MNDHHTEASADTGNSHGHPNDDRDHGGHKHPQRHPHDHDHSKGLRGAVKQIFAPHSHDAAESLDSALESSAAGIRAVRISLLVLGITAIVQIVILVCSGSIALAADTIHNFCDALTAVPLWIAFALSTKAATRRYTYGFGRVEDLAGLFVVAMITLSAIIAGYEAIMRLIQPQPIDNVEWVALAGLIGFIGNEWVAVYRIRVGRRIGSAALIADGLHARTDGFTSLAVLFAAGGVAMGYPLADPIIGLVITWPFWPCCAPRYAMYFDGSLTAWIPHSSTPPKPPWPPDPVSARCTACACAGLATICTPTPNSTSTPP